MLHWPDSLSDSTLRLWEWKVWRKKKNEMIIILLLLLWLIQLLLNFQEQPPRSDMGTFLGESHLLANMVSKIEQRQQITFGLLPHRLHLQMELAAAVKPKQYLTKFLFYSMSLTSISKSLTEDQLINTPPVDTNVQYMEDQTKGKGYKI